MAVGCSSCPFGSKTFNSFLWVFSRVPGLGVVMYKKTKDLDVQSNDRFSRMHQGVLAFLFLVEVHLDGWSSPSPYPAWMGWQSTSVL